MWTKTNLYAWTHSEHGWVICKWWTLTGLKNIYYSTYVDRESLEKGINTATFTSLKEAKESFTHQQEACTIHES